MRNETNYKNIPTYKTKLRPLEAVKLRRGRQLQAAQMCLLQAVKLGQWQLQALHADGLLRGEKLQLLLLRGAQLLMLLLLTL